MRFTKQDVLLGIVVLLVGYNIFTTNSIRTDVKGYERRIDSVQTKIDSAQVINKQIDVKIDSVKENVPMVYDSIKEKIKYFNPAFHSMTPEGLNARLTFLI